MLTKTTRNARNERHRMSNKNLWEGFSAKLNQRKGRICKPKGKLKELESISKDKELISENPRYTQPYEKTKSTNHGNGRTTRTLF